MKRGLFLSGLAASFLCIGQLLHAGVPVRGNVSDTDNRPLIGVVVIEEGTANNAAVTDVSGNSTTPSTTSLPEQAKLSGLIP